MTRSPTCIGLIAVLLASGPAPATLAGQECSRTVDGNGPGARTSGAGQIFADAGPALSAAHADHAALHRPSAADAAIPLAAAELIGFGDDADALCRAAKLAITVGLLSEDAAERVAWFDRAREYAREAVSLRPRDPDALFMEAAALGMKVDYLPIARRPELARQVLMLSDSILALDPDHAGGHHVRGQLGAAAMRLNPVVRYVVARVLGAARFADASWAGAESALRTALAAEPDNPLFRIELVYLLRDTERSAEARRELVRILALGSADPFTYHYRQRARTLLAAGW